MKTSTITLYYKSLLNKDKNFILDNPNNGKSAVENYLSTLEKQVITGFQYVKHQVVLSIKIDKNQDALNMGLDSQDLNYIKIQNQGEASPKYYFIVGKTWKAESTIELTLNMDTLNSFEFNKDYEINEKTLVKREHRDRFKTFPTLSFDWEMTCPRGLSYHFHTDLNLSVADVVSVSFEMLGAYVIRKSDIHIEGGVNSDGIKGLLASVNNRSVFDNVTIRIHVIYRLSAFYRNIDLKSEEINTPVYKYDEDIILEQEGKSNVNWALFYKNRDNQDNSPVDCYLIPDTAINAVYQTSDQQISHSQLPDNNYIILYSQNATGFNVDVNGANYNIRKSSGWAYGTFQNWTLLALKKNGTNVEVYQAKMEYKVLFFPQIPQFTGSWTKIWTGAYVTIDFIADSMDAREVTSLPSSASWCLSALTPIPTIGNAYTINFGTTDSKPITTTNQIDKTDSKNIKIIDVPYCPSSFDIDENGSFVFPTPWKLDANEDLLKLRDLNTRFENQITSGSRNILVDFIQNVRNTDLTKEKRFLKDSKLYHSDYYRNKFVYDSFSKVFELEKLNFIPSSNESNFFQFTFVMSRNIVSKFLFKFNYKYKTAIEDYENIVAVSRNNEEVLYNSQYLNYVRTGYNYDLKAKERQDTSSAVGIGLSALGMVASIAIAVATENPLPLAGAIASGIGLVGQSVNYAKQTAQNEENIQRKLQEAQQQAVSVLNADDSDLLFAYSGNKAKICYYKASDKMIQILDDLFYYGGYLTNEQKIPNVRTRYWFNFVQASLIMEETNNLTEEIENDIKQKFENGVTFLHNRQNRFDFKQEMENIEDLLVGG